MAIEIAKSNKEMWLAKNISKENITIGDLPLLPLINSDKSVNLLTFHHSEKIAASPILTYIVQNNKITIEKIIQKEK